MSADGGGSSIIDDEGKLFGVVNVIDALVVLLVAAVLIAGAAFVLGLGGESETRYVTVDLGDQPQYTAQQISPGDEWEAGGGFTITDVYMAPAEGDEPGTSNVMVRAEVNGSEIDPELGEGGPISFDGEPLRFGRQLEIQTNQYAVEGTVIDVAAEGTEIESTTEELAVQATVDADTASAIQPGDEYRVGDTSVLTVESVTSYPTGEDDERRVVLGVSANTRIDGDTALLGQEPVRTGNAITIETRAYSIDTRIINTGSLEEPGSPTTMTATVELEAMSEDRAQRFAVGMSETIGDTQTASLTDIEIEPYEEIVHTGDGYEVIEHPRDRDVTLTVDLEVRELDDGTVRFRGETLEMGDDIRLRLNGLTAEGEVVTLQ